MVLREDLNQKLERTMRLLTGLDGLIAGFLKLILADIPEAAIAIIRKGYI